MKWAKHEIEFLRANYESQGPQYCANSLAREIAGVHRQAHRLGLKCNSAGGFNPDKSGTLYFVSFSLNNRLFYKLGITNNTPESRLRADWNKYDFKVEWIISHKDGKVIQKMERELLLKYKNKLINTQSLSSGNTETLSVYIEQPKEIK